jgi:hypothetical protein
MENTRMEETKAIAVAGYKRVLENGDELYSSESAAEHSDRGGEFPIHDMYTPDMLNEKGEPVSIRAMMTTEQADRLRSEERAGGQDTVSGARRQDIWVGNVRSE